MIGRQRRCNFDIGTFDIQARQSGQHLWRGNLLFSLHFLPRDADGEFMHRLPRSARISAPLLGLALKVAASRIRGYVLVVLKRILTSFQDWLSGRILHRREHANRSGEEQYDSFFMGAKGDLAGVSVFAESTNQRVSSVRAGRNANLTSLTSIFAHFGAQPHVDRIILYRLTTNFWSNVFAPKLSLAGACLHETFCSYSTTMVETVCGASRKMPSREISEMFDVTHIHQRIARHGHVHSTRLSRDHVYSLFTRDIDRHADFALRFDGMWIFALASLSQPFNFTFHIRTSQTMMIAFLGRVSCLS